MTNKLVVIINRLKVPKIKKIFTIWNEISCTQLQLSPEPLTRGLPLPDPRRFLCPQLNLLNPPPEQNSWVRHCLYLTFYLLHSYVFPAAHARCIMASGMIVDQWRIGCKQCQWPGSCCRRGWMYEPPSNIKVPHTPAWFQTLSPLFSYFPLTPYMSLHPCSTYRYTQDVSDRTDISNKTERLQKCEQRIRCLTLYQVWRAMLSSSHLVGTHNILQSIKFVFMDIYTFVRPTYW